MDRRIALYISSSIGLGHVSKDMAIAAELRRVRPDIEILWLAGHPASNALRHVGEKVIPEAERWIGASRLAESCTHNGRLNLVRYDYCSLPAWAANARLFRTVLKCYDVDIVIGNEAYEICIPLILGIHNLRVPFVMILDFVGTDPMTPSVLDHMGAYVLNAMWAMNGRLYDGGRHSAIFIGEVDDIPARPFGWALPDRRRHAQNYYDVLGHIIGFRPEEYTDRTAWRRRLGYGEGPLIVCSVGGTSIGRGLLELCGQAFVALHESLPGVHMVLVCGPRIPMESVRVPGDIELRGYVPRLHELYACCDVAVVQCGASSTTELSAHRRCNQGYSAHLASAR